MKTTLFNNDYTFKINNSSNKNSFRNTNYSKILDDLILADMIKKNPYLTNSYKNEDDLLIDNMFKELNNKSTNLNNSFIAAAKYLSIFGKKNEFPYTLGHTYYIDNNAIIFHLDSIEINGEEFYFDDLLKKNLPKKTQNLIIKITTSAPKININIFS